MGHLKALSAPLLLLTLIFLSGCGGPLKVVYNPPPVVVPSDTDAVKTPTAIQVLPFTDSRPEKDNPRVIGDITVTVADLSGDRLVLSESPVDILSTAFAEELRTGGYTMIADRKNGAPQADYVLSGNLLEFRLDLGSRDNISIKTYLQLTDAGTGKVVYSKIKEEEDSRYAGVLGNSRGSISKYISVTLSKLIRGAISEASVEIARHTATAGPAGPEALTETAPDAIPEGKGRLLVTTIPERAKVHIEGVYYGLTPLTLDLTPKIYVLTVSKEGFKDLSEKVAIDNGRVTEFELSLKTETED